MGLLDDACAGRLIEEMEIVATAEDMKPIKARIAAHIGALKKITESIDLAR